MKTWGGLTIVQVEALRECLDFLRNGYREEGSVTLAGVTYLKLRHSDTRSIIIVKIWPWRYVIRHDRKTVKDVAVDPDHKRYDCEVNSLMKLNVTRSRTSAKTRLIFGSVLPKHNG